MTIMNAGKLLEGLVGTLQQMAERGSSEGPNPYRSFSRGHIPGITPSKGTLEHVCSELHGLLRHKTVHLHKSMLSAGNAFHTQLATTPALKSQPRDGLNAMRALIIPTSIATDAECMRAGHALSEALEQRTTQQKAGNTISLLESWQLLLAYKKFYAQCRRIDAHTTESPSWAALDSSFDTMAKGLHSQLKDLPTTVLSLADPLTGNTITAPLANTIAGSSVAFTLISMLAGQGMLDDDKIPKSLRELYSRNGQTTGITQAWHSVTDRIYFTLEQSGFDRTHIQSILVANGFMLGERELAPLRQSILAYAPQLGFDCALERGAGKNTLFTQAANLVTRFLSIPINIPPYPLATNAAQLEQLASALYLTCLKETSGKNPQIRKSLQPLVDAFPSIADQNSIRDPAYYSTRSTPTPLSARTRTSIMRSLEHFTPPLEDATLFAYTHLKFALAESLQQPHISAWLPNEIGQGRR